MKKLLNKIHEKNQNRKWDIKLITGLSVIIFGILYCTISPTIAGGDSGELVAEGCELGVSHPPGYPIFSVLTHLLYRVHLILPVLSTAYLVNLLSVILTSSTSYFIGCSIQLTAQESSHQISSIIIGMGMFSFSPLIWQYATTAEVFPLNSLFASVILYSTIRFSKYFEVSVLYYGAFICGLALCNQHTIILYEIPLILWLLYLSRRVIYHQPIILIKLLVCFLLGLTPYIYLPLSAIYNPTPGSWGNVSNWKGFLHHFLRKDYGTFQLYSGNSGRPTAQFIERTYEYFKDVHYNQGLYIAPILVVVAIIKPFIPTTIQKTQKVSVNGTKKSDNNVIDDSRSSSSSLVSKYSSIEAGYTSIILLIMQCFYFGVFHSLSNLPLNDPLLYAVHQRFWMQPNVLLFIWVGIGYDGISNIIESILTYLNTIIYKFQKPSNKAPSIVIVFRIIVFIVAIVIVLIQINKWKYISDQSNATFFRDYALALLAPLSKNSIFIINYDQHWTSTRYLQLCEGFRPDVTTINLSMMTYGWFAYKRKLFTNITFPGMYLASPNSIAVHKSQAFTLASFLKSNMDRYKIYFTGKLNYPDPELDEKFESVQLGLVTQFVPKIKAPNGTHYKQLVSRSLRVVLKALPSLPDLQKYPQSTWEWTIGRDFKDRIAEIGAYALQTAIEISHKDPIPLVYATYLLETGISYEKNLSIPSNLLKNTGLAHLHLVQNKLLDGNSALPLSSLEDVFQTMNKIGWPSNTMKWKSWCTDRFVSYWGEFVNRSDALKDPQYSTIKNMYEVVTTAGANIKQPRTDQTDKKVKKTKKKKSKKINKNPWAQH